MLTQNYEMTNYFTPSILLSEILFYHRKVKGAIAAAVDRVAGEGFYLGIEIADVADPEDRKNIGRIVHGRSIRLTYWTSMILNDEKLNLSALDENLRKKTALRIKQELPAAAECGATGFAVLSGPDPGPVNRAAATEQLCRSLGELADALKAYPGMRLLLEPLDREAHKNALVGPTGEAAALVRRVRQVHPEFGLSWDTAHVALCGEDILDSIKTFCPCIAQIHLANAVLDRTNPQFGDHHMPIGKPGFLNSKVIAALFRQAAEIGLFGKNKPGVSVEVRTAQQTDPWENEAGCRRVLQVAWELFAKETA
jgi:hydroxypyruvate isomerase